MNLRGGKGARELIENLKCPPQEILSARLPFFWEISSGGYLFLHFGEHILWRAFVLAFFWGHYQIHHNLP